MSETVLPILQNAAVMHRTSAGTRRVLEERAAGSTQARFLAPELSVVLQRLVEAILPQAVIGTDVDIAAAIDKRLADGTGDGWRFAELPNDGEAYQRGLKWLAGLRDETPLSGDFLRHVATGDFDVAAGLPLSKWLLTVKTDAVRAWVSHPAAMAAMQYYGFADGTTGMTDGPTEVEGWQGITTDKALHFEAVIGDADERVSPYGGAA